MVKYFDFERDIQKIDDVLDSLDKFNSDNSSKINQLQLERTHKLKSLYSRLEPWQKVQVSRHNDRPHSIDYINNIFGNIIYLH